MAASELLLRMADLDGKNLAGELSRLLATTDDALRTEALAALESAEDMQQQLNAKQRRKLKRLLSNKTALGSPDTAEVPMEQADAAVEGGSGDLSIADIIQGLRSSSSRDDAELFLNALKVPGKDEDSDLAAEFRNALQNLTQTLTDLLNANFTNKVLRRRISRLLYHISPSHAPSSTSSGSKTSKKRSLSTEGGGDKSEMKDQQTTKRRRIARKGEYREETSDSSGASKEPTILRIINAENATQLEKAIGELSDGSDSKEFQISPSLIERFMTKVDELTSSTPPYAVPSAMRRRLRRLLTRLVPASLDQPDSKAESEGHRDRDSETPKSPYFTLFVGQIPYNANSEDLREFFINVGDLSEDIKVRLLTDKTSGASKGMAFVQVLSVEEVGSVDILIYSLTCALGEERAEVASPHVLRKKNKR